MDVLRSLSPSRSSVDASGGSVVSDRNSVTLFRTHSDGTLSTTDYGGSLERSTSIAPVKTHIDGLKHGEESPFHNPFNVLGREESNGIPSSSSSCSNHQLFPFDHSSSRSMFLSDPNTSPSVGEGLSDDREEGLISPPLSVALTEDSSLPHSLQTGISPLFASAVNISAQLQSHGHLSGTESLALQSRDQSVGSIRDQSRLPTPIPLPSSHANSTSFINHGSLNLNNHSPSHHSLQLSAIQAPQIATLKESRQSPKSALSPSALHRRSTSPRRLTVSTDTPTLAHPHISPLAASAQSTIQLLPTAVVAPAIPAGAAASAFAFNFAPTNSATRILRPPGSIPVRPPMNYAPLPLGFDDEGVFLPGRKRKNWRRAQLDTADGARRSLQPHYRYRVKLNHGLEQLRMMTCPTFQDATHYDILTCAIARIHELEEEIRLLEYHEDLARRRREKRLSLATPKRRKTQFNFEGTTARDEEGNVIEGPSASSATESAEPSEKKEGEETPAASGNVKKEQGDSIEGAGDQPQSIAEPKALSPATDTVTSQTAVPTPRPSVEPSDAASLTAEAPSSPPAPSSSSTETDKEGNAVGTINSTSPGSRLEGAAAVSAPVNDQSLSATGTSPAKASDTTEPEVPDSTPELHSLLFHSACLPRFILSTSFEFIAVNRAYAALFLAPIDLRGLSFLSIVQSELVQPASLTLASVLESPDDVMQIEGLKIIDEGAVYSCELIIWCAREVKEDGTRVATCIQGVELSRQPLIMARP